MGRIQAHFYIGSILVVETFQKQIPINLLFQTRPSALGMSDPTRGPLIYIFVDEKKKCEG